MSDRFIYNDEHGFQDTTSFENPNMSIEDVLDLLNNEVIRSDDAAVVFGSNGEIRGLIPTDDLSPDTPVPFHVLVASAVLAMTASDSRMTDLLEWFYEQAFNQASEEE